MTSKWLYNESAIAGVDYSDNDIAADYDKHHTKFRDYEGMALRIVDALKIKPDDVIIDHVAATINAQLDTR